MTESSETPRLSQASIGFTPSEELTNWIESPPEYSPPTDVGFQLPSEKAEEKSAPVAPSEVDSEESSPSFDDELRRAVAKNDIVEVVDLLKRGADPNEVQGSLQRSPLHQAAHLNFHECLTVLFRYGAIVGTEDSKGDTGLHLAAWAGNVEACEVLIAQGADIDWISGRDGYSPLWCAITARHIDVARLLLRKGARVSQKSNGGLVPLHQAAVTRQTAMCELLLDRGADVDCLDGEDNTPLHYAATTGEATTVQVLLNHGAQVDCRQKQRLSPLHWAAHKGHTSIARLLLDCGAKVNARSHESAIPLHLAANRGHLATVRLLLDKGADTRRQTSSWDGVAGAALDLARAKGHKKVVELLERHMLALKKD